MVMAEAAMPSLPEAIQQIAERLRQEPYHLLWNDCLTKSVRFRRACRRRGIATRMVVCLGLVRAKVGPCWLTVPVIHGWGEVAGERVEVSRPLGAAGDFGIVPRDIRPVLSLRF